VGGFFHTSVSGLAAMLKGVFIVAGLPAMVMMCFYLGGNGWFDARWDEDEDEDGRSWGFIPAGGHSHM